VFVLGTIVFITIRFAYGKFSGEVWERSATLGSLISMITMSPIGWLLHGMLSGPTWALILSFILTVKFKSRKPMLLTLAATLVFGMLWPGWFWGMMSV